MKTLTQSPEPAAVASTEPLLSAPVRFSPPPVGSLSPIPAASSFPSPSMGPPPIGSLAQPPAAVLPSPVAPIPVPAAPPAVAKPAAPPVAASVPPVNAADPAAGMGFDQMIELAKQVRGLGDMQGALEVLKRADLQFPNRPAVLAETALCYEQMGLTDKATALWRQIEGMDPAQAAGYGDLARRRLSAAPVAAASTGSEVGTIESSVGKVLSLGACQAVRDPSVSNGEKVVLRIPVLRQGQAPIDPSQVDIDVYFFDRVNGERVAQTIADEPVSSWTAAPVDWSGIGEEPLEVTYFLPTLTPGEVAAHGRRSYHGYVVRLYYQHKLQDVAAEPRDLLEFGSRAPRSAEGGAHPLLPPVSQ